MGRPSDYGPEIAAAICERLAEGETLRAICADDDMPSRSMVHRWILAHEEFRDQYTRAREVQMDTWADEIVEIADDAHNDFGLSRAVRLNGVYPPTDDERDPKFNAEHVQRAKLRIDTRKWLMGKAAPKKYGERVEIEHGGKVQHSADEAITRIFGRLDAAAGLKSGGGLGESEVD